MRAKIGLDLQNRDGGWPTFCRGWGALPFDRSAADLTAHALRALFAWKNRHRPLPNKTKSPSAAVNSVSIGNRRIERATAAGFAYLARTQRADGSWLPLWFGNQHAADDENPVYGTARVLAAYRDTSLVQENSYEKGIAWLASVQNADGGWGGAKNTPSSVEETALAVETLLSVTKYADAVQRGLGWLLDQVEGGTFRQPAPIGLYFAKLWYFEQLYPIIFTASALGRAIEQASETIEPRTAAT